jgi:soluble lytic murein transglycosylase-like protein
MQAAPVSAGPPAFPDFTFKRVLPPDATTKKRITIQIAPEAAPSSVESSEEPAATPGSSAEPSGWFWALVPAEDDRPAAPRFTAAMKALEGASNPRAPRLQHLQKLAEAHGTGLLRHSVGTGVSPAFALAVMAVESAGRSSAQSQKGALGLMQLMPDTARRFGVDPSRDDENIRGGIAYLDWLLARFKGDPLLALAGYNAGENAVSRHRGVPPYPETRAYIPKVLAAWRVARQLCLTPPELISDGCVFGLRSASSNSPK